MIEKPEKAIKNGQSRDTDNIGHTRHKAKIYKTKTQHRKQKNDKQHGPTKIISRRVSSWLLCAKHINDNHYNNLTSNPQELTSPSYSIRVSG